MRRLQKKVELTRDLSVGGEVEEGSLKTGESMRALSEGGGVYAPIGLFHSLTTRVWR